jgi:hypothetical protein
MKDKKLTDNEIKKALECCTESSHCSKCPFANIPDVRICTSKMSELALDLINRLQAENERLKNAYKQCAWERDAYIEIENIAIAEAKAEAYMECIEKENVK